MTALRTLGRLLAAASVAAAAVGGLSASVGRTTPRVEGYWIVLGSDRDGQGRAYSMRPDGSRLTPLLPRTRALEPSAVSRDGGTIAYYGQYALYVTRADGTRLRRLVGGAFVSFNEPPALSRDGRLLAFHKLGAPGIWIVGTDRGGLRRLTSGTYDAEPDWSPDGKALVFTTHDVIVVQPLQGSRRVLVHGGFDRPKWSPDGRWIAYMIGDQGLGVVRSNGQDRHRVARGWIRAFAWSPDGSRLAAAVGYPPNVAVVGVDGRGLKALRLGLTISAVAWSRDARRLILAGHAGDDPDQIWVVGQDGGGLRRLTSAGANNPIGWTRLAPVRPPASPLLPSERVIAADTVATRAPVASLSADGPRVAFIPSATATDCDHVSVWTPATKSIVRLSPHLPAPCTSRDTGTVRYTIYDLELAGSRAAWADVEGCGNFCDVALKSATLARPLPLVVSSEGGGGGAGGGELVDFHVHGHGELLVFNDGSRLVQIGGGSELCQESGDYRTSICATIRSGAHAAPVEAVSGKLIAIREPDAVAIVDAQGKLVRVFPFGPGEVSAARLDGNSLVVARAGVLEVYDASTGAGELQRPLPSGYALTDVDGGIAVLQRATTIMLLRLGDGRSRTLAPGRAPVSADLEPPGLYYSYATADGGGRLVFLPRSEILRQLG